MTTCNKAQDNMS